MNINDVTEVPHCTNYLEGIFNRQRELHEKYKHIEQANGIGLALIHDVPFDINDARWQYVTKDYFWRVTEELAECIEANNKNHQVHAIEEAIDALHFYTELLILHGIDEADIVMIDGDMPLIAQDVIVVIYMMGLAANCLKQKPWKNSPFFTDEKLFYDHLKSGYRFLIELIRRYFDLTMEELYIFYYKKSEVNNFRIRSNY